MLSPMGVACLARRGHRHKTKWIASQKPTTRATGTDTMLWRSARMRNSTIGGIRDA